MQVFIPPRAAIDRCGRMATDPAHLAFCRARRDQATAFSRWLETNPPAEDIRDELGGTLGQLLGLAGLRP